jgi:toxin ParE1/3/4
MNRVSYDHQARQDLDQIAEHIAAHNLDAAIRFCLAVEKAVQQLAQMPGMGRPREYQAADGSLLRSWSVSGFEKYLLFYCTVSDGIHVVRIVHGARNLDAIFRDH